MKNVIFNKNVKDGWYVVQATENIKWDGMRLDIPFTIENKIGSNVDCKSVNFVIMFRKNKKYAERDLSNILECLGAWESLNFIFPDNNTVCLEQKVINHIKVKVPGRFCVVHVIHDDEGFCRINCISKVGIPLILLNKDYYVGFSYSD